MGADPFELIARVLGMNSDEFRRLTADNATALGPDALTNLLGVDLAALSDLQERVERGDVEWEAAFDADVNWLADATRPSRRTRRGIGIRPGHRRPRSRPSQDAPPTRPSWECPTCDRTFLSFRGLQRHYETNPSHADAVIDVRDIAATCGDAQRPDSEWVVFDDRVETFVTLPKRIDEDEIRVAHRPDETAVEISGPYEAAIDTSSVSDLIGEDVTWHLTGRYLVLSFPLQPDDSTTEAGKGE